MANNLRVISTTDVDAATLTSGDFTASLPVGNLQLEGRARVARTTNATGTKTINGNFAGSTLCSALVLYGHNLTGTATWRLRLYAGANQTGTVVYDSTTLTPLTVTGWGSFAWGVEPWGSGVFRDWQQPFYTLWFSEVFALSFRLELVDTLNPAGYLQASRLIIGRYLTPTFNAEYGLALAWETNSEQRRTLGGSVRTDRRASFRRLSFDLGLLDLSERALWLDLARSSGLHRELFVSVYPQASAELERDHSILVKFSQAAPNTLPVPNRWSQKFEMIEV
jgi:hypothetical protein